MWFASCFGQKLWRHWSFHMFPNDLLSIMFCILVRCLLFQRLNFIPCTCCWLKTRKDARGLLESGVRVCSLTQPQERNKTIKGDLSSLEILCQQIPTSVAHSDIGFQLTQFPARTERSHHQGIQYFHSIWVFVCVVHIFWHNWETGTSDRTDCPTKDVRTQW